MGAFFPLSYLTGSFALVYLRCRFRVYLVVQYRLLGHYNNVCMCVTLFVAYANCDS